MPQSPTGASSANVNVTNESLTVEQPTGSDLHVVVDSGTVIATQSTAANLKVSLADTATNTNALKARIVDKYGFEVEATPTDQLRVITPHRLIGTGFVGTTLDTNFWTPTTANGGTVAQANAEVTLQTNTTADGAASLVSIRAARYIAGYANMFRALVQLGDTGTANNIRRWGAFDANDGYFFELNGTTLNVVTRKGTTDTPVASGAWNGTSFALDTNVHTYEIYYTNSKVYFVADGVLRHTVLANAATVAATNNFHITLSNVNSGGATANIVMECRVASIHRLGEEETDPTYKNLTTAGTTVLKYGPGTLHTLLINDGPALSNIVLYDNTAGSGSMMSTINTAAIANPTTLDLHVPFYTGLTCVMTGNVNVTFVYE